MRPRFGKARGVPTCTFLSFIPCSHYGVDLPSLCKASFCAKDQHMATANPLILTKFRTALRKLYGDRIERIVLYGSRARGDARADSDYDLAVFLKNMANRWNEIDQIVRIEEDILDETGVVINALPFMAGSYTERTPLMHEIRQEGIEV